MGEEVAYTKIYVNILKMRYIDLFDVTYDVDASVADKRILKLCLQPLVENAINHGLIEKEHDGHITISIQNQKGLLSIEVTDNGVGMSEEALQKLRERIYENDVIDGKQIGIKNVRQRIKLLYGEQYDIEIYSREGEGTRICFKVPML